MHMLFKAHGNGWLLNNWLKTSPEYFHSGLLCSEHKSIHHAYNSTGDVEYAFKKFASRK